MCVCISYYLLNFFSFCPLGRAVSEDLKDSKKKVVVSSGEVIIVSHLRVSDNLVSKEGMKAL